MPSKEEAREAFRRRVRESLKRADEEFRGRYGDEIRGLLGLSAAQIDGITPGTTDVETYNQLLVVVKEASRVNLEQAELLNRIKALGDVAVGIAKLVPSLGAMF